MLTLKVERSVAKSLSLETDINSNPEYSTHWLNCLKQITDRNSKGNVFKNRKKCGNRNVIILFRNIDINGRN